MSTAFTPSRTSVEDAVFGVVLSAIEPYTQLSDEPAPQMIGPDQVSRGGTPYSPSASWVRVELRPLSGTQAAFGASRYRNYSMLICEIYTPRSYGSEVSNYVAKLIKDCLQAVLPWQVSGLEQVLIRDVSYSQGNQDSEWSHTAVVATVEYDETS